MFLLVFLIASVIICFCMIITYFCTEKEIENKDYQTIMLFKITDIIYDFQTLKQLEGLEYKNIENNLINLVHRINNNWILFQNLVSNNIYTLISNAEYIMHLSFNEYLQKLLSFKQTDIFILDKEYYNLLKMLEDIKFILWFK